MITEEMLNWAREMAEELTDDTKEPELWERYGYDHDALEVATRESPLRKVRP